MTENTSLLPEDKLKLKSWGLPKDILQKYANRGITAMFPWQVECLTAGNVLSGGNLVYSAPTSAGKTMVAEILAIQTILERKKKVILILPFVSVVREKMVYLQNILAGTGIKVDGFMGTYHPPGGFKLVHLAVCTIEKANSLINRLIEENSMDDVGCVVIDELHLLGDPHRGYLLELLLTKLKYLSERDYASRIQIVGMSATLPNLNVVADWLNATLYSTDFRPIPLTEYVKVGTNIYSSPDLRFSHEIQPTFNVKNDAGDVIYLCIDTLLNGYSAIVFCPTKNWCETLSYQISSEIKRLGFEKNDIGSSLRQQLNSQAIADTLEQLKRCPAGLDKTLARSVSFGVAFHHAGLTLDERDIVEAAFKQNILRVLVATSTLSSGVNLPARRVIIRSPTFYGKCMDILTYKQMIGRAGRMGRDTEGESFLICNEVEKQYGEYLVKSDLPPVESCLGQGGLTSCLKRALLEVIACGIVTSRSEVEQYTKCTLLYVSTNSETIDETISTCIEYLQSNNFIKLRDDGDITASALAEACLSASIQPDQGLKLLKELYKARKCFILHTDLHAIYQSRSAVCFLITPSVTVHMVSGHWTCSIAEDDVYSKFIWNFSLQWEVTPYSICDQWAVDWMRVFSVWEDLPDHMRAVGELVGVEDRFLIKAMRSNINMNSSEHLHKISIHKRFYTALALQDLINEVPLKEVSQKYDCNKGMLQSLQQSASTFAGMVHHFCKRLGWGGLEVIVAELSQRIQFGVHRDLLDLLRLDCISAHCARSLFNAGIKTLPDLASAQLRDIENALRKSTPYDSDTVSSPQAQRKHVWISGHNGMTETEAAEIFIHEARRFLLVNKEMGVKSASWENDCTKPSPENEATNNSLMTHVSDSNYSTNFERESFPNNKELTLQEPLDCSSMVKTDSSSRVQILKKDTDFRMNKSVSAYIDQVQQPRAQDNDQVQQPRAQDNLISFPSEINIAEAEISVKSSSRLSVDLFDNLDDIHINLASPSDNKNYSNEEGEILEGINLATEMVCGVAVLRNETLENTNKELNEDTNVFKDAIITNIEICPENIELNPDVKSSTPIACTLNKINVRAKSRTSEYVGKDHSSCGQNPTDTSGTDMFFDSFAFNSSSINNALACAMDNDGQVLDEFDPNWGGESLLQASFIIEELVEKNGPILKKRKRKESSSEEELVSTKISRLDMSKGVFDIAHSNLYDGGKSVNTEQSERNSYLEQLAEHNSLEKNVNADLFEGTFEMNSQIAGYLDLNTSQTVGHNLKGDKFQKQQNPGDNVVNLIKESCDKHRIPDSYVSGHDFLVPNKCVPYKKKQSKIIDPKTDIEGKPSFSANALANELLKLNNPFETKYTEENDINVKNCEMKTKNFNNINEFTDSFLKKAFDCSFQPSNVTTNQKFNLNLDPNPSDLKLNDIKDLTSHNDVESNEIEDEEFVASSQDTGFGIPGMSPLILKRKVVKEKMCDSTYPTNMKSAESKSEIAENAMELKCASLSKESKQSSQGPEQNYDMKNKNGDFLYVCADKNLLKRFKQTVMKYNEVGFVLKIERGGTTVTKERRIGYRIMGKKWQESDITTPDFSFGSISIIGVALNYKSKCYYLDLRNSGCNCIPILRQLLMSADLKLYGYGIKEQLNILYKCCGFLTQCKIFDVAVADWILNPEEKPKTLSQLGSLYLPKDKITQTGKDDSTSEVLLIWRLQKALKKKLHISNIIGFFEEVEMPTQICLGHMELSGIAFDRESANELWSRVETVMNHLQEEAYAIAGRRFNLCSCKDVGKVKESLNIMKENESTHPLCLIVHNWRKLNSLKTRNLSPLLLTTGDRLHGTCDTRTVTGRVSMHDPNIQHIPRDFSIGDNKFSLRSSFIAREGNIILSADFCQLELRVLAHFSQDPVLLSLFTSDLDVFVKIASHWNKIGANEVTDEIRHQTKQLCYGIIYGMGDVALGEALGISSIEAAELSTKFHHTYSGIQEFVQSCINECRSKGYITTLKGRVRYLPEINSKIATLRNQAERQAVNSTIQGSAADIAKSAMVEIEKYLRIQFPDRPLVLSSGMSAHLVLQLHDELIYEVSENKVNEVISIVRRVMETATKLSVPLPVKVRKGLSWGSLQVVQ